MREWQAEPVAEVTDRSADSVPVLLPAVDGGGGGEPGMRLVDGGSRPTGAVTP
jgi:hypothetical protein